VRWFQRAAALGALLSLTACASSKVYVAKEYQRPQRIAVLPMANETNDLDGPRYVRKALFDYLAQSGYTLVPLAEIDEKLKAQGFTDGGQLGAATPQKIGEWVGADGLFYSTLEDFNYILLGYYTQRTVKIKGGLVSAASGKKLWEADRGWSTRLFATDKKEAQRALAIQLAAKMVERMAQIPLVLETREAVIRLLTTLPK
jgi:hypothetical protein